MRHDISLPFGSLLAVLVLSTGSANAAAGGKTPRECNSELYARLAAIQAAGETASQFVHDCWYHSQAGRPTALAHPTPAASREAAETHMPAAGPHRRAELHPEPRLRIALGRRAIRSHRIAEARRVEKEQRRLARVARAARVRLALEVAGERSAEPHARTARLATLRAARMAVRRQARETRVAATPLKQARRVASNWTSDTLGAVAELGPTAREGQRMWVRVVAAGEVHIKPAVAVGSLSDRVAGGGALNCWGQPVMFVGRAGNRWSREMVCDGKPAGSNEWSAQIYYGGASTR